jgi:CheY-like chemotaxis protein
MRVLIADDDKDQLMVRKMLLNRLGFEAILASDQQAALSAAKTRHPECAVVDFLLPDEGSGLNLIRELKRLDPQIHIFVLTGRSPKQLEHLPERALIDDVIGKGTPASIWIEKLKTLRNSAQV